MPSPDVSVVLPVHGAVRPEHLRRAVDSLLEQTRPAEEVVLVEDGPLPGPLRDAVAYARDVLPVSRAVLPVNLGAGAANQAGLELARGDWIAKADADDVSLPQRLERQYEAVVQGRADVCGSAMLEFDEDEANVRSVRRAPLSHERIGRRLRSNNPINHPTAFYRRRSALEAGGYPGWRYMQDYGLFARMYAAGSVMMNLEEPLVLFRNGAAVTQRRRSRDIRQLEVAVQRELRDLELITTPRMLVNVAWRSTYRVLPTRVVTEINRRLLARRLPRT